MLIKYFLSGFFIKIVTSLDDTFTRIPIIATLTKTRIGKVAFSIGNFLSILVALTLTYLFASIIDVFALAKHFSAGLIVLLALAIYYNLFTPKKKEKIEKKKKKEIAMAHEIKTITRKKFIRLIVIGFIISFMTILDDSIAFVPLFLNTKLEIFSAVAGIIIATILQIIVVIYFATKINKLKYKKELASIGLMLLAVLILFGVV